MAQSRNLRPEAADCAIVLGADLPYAVSKLLVNTAAQHDRNIMSTTLFNAKPYDPKAERRKWIRIGVAVVVLLALGITAWSLRYWSYERRVDSFFKALEAKDYDKAYGIWFNDPDWKQHPQNHKQYPMGEFYIDWGPGGEYGLIKSHHIDKSGSSGKRGTGTGVIVVVTVNERSEKAKIWVEKGDKTLSFAPDFYY